MNTIRLFVLGFAFSILGCGAQGQADGTGKLFSKFERLAELVRMRVVESQEIPLTEDGRLDVEALSPTISTDKDFMDRVVFRSQITPDLFGEYDPNLPIGLLDMKKFSDKGVKRVLIWRNDHLVELRGMTQDMYIEFLEKLGKSMVSGTKKSE